MAINYYVFGADPGAQGGFVRIAPDGAKVSYRFKDKEDIEIWTELCRLTSPTKPYPAYIELLQSFGDVKAERLNNLFKMRENSGILQGLLIAAGCKIIKVQPQVWKREFSLVGVGKDYEERKKAAHKVAKELFGDWVTKDIADALLIAEYGWRKENGTLTGGIKNGGALRPGTGIVRVTGELAKCSDCGIEACTCIRTQRQGTILCSPSTHT